MHRYVIERDLPNVGDMSTDQLQAVRKTSNAALADAGPGVQWVESFVTADRIYCHYLAENEELVRDHARRAGLPCNNVSQVRTVVDPLLAVAQEP
jgi:hypothetical protein